MRSEQKELTFGKIFVFWVPLAATWLMMAFEAPFVAAVIARMEAARFNLAAFGVAMSIALIVEGPIIMLMGTSTALVKDRQAYLKLRQFTWTLNGFITIAMIGVVIPPVFNFLAQDLIGLPEPIVRLAHIASIILLPWPGAIGFRRFYQGLLIRNNLTRRVAYGTIIRLVTMAGSALFFYSLRIPGASVGAAALSMGVMTEALATRVMADKVIKNLIKTDSQKLSNQLSNPLTYGFIIRFYFPLALTSILALGVHPIVTFFMGKGRYPIESLAVLPVINALVFVWRSLGLSFMEVAIALLGDRGEGYDVLRNFALVLGIGVVAGLAVIAFTPLATVWFQRISGLSHVLTQFSRLPTQIMVLLPGLTVLVSFQRSILVNASFTGPVTVASAIEVLTIIIVLSVSVFYLDLMGAAAAALAFTAGRICANLYLIPKQRIGLQRVRTEINRL